MGMVSRDRHWRALEPTVTFAEALQWPAPPPGLSVGLAPLDELTGGLRPGDVWVVEGPAGAGVSMLALQIAAAAAGSGRSAAVVCDHLPVPVQLARLVSQTARVHLSHLWPPDGLLDPGEHERSASASQRLVGGGSAPDVLVVDTVAAELSCEPGSRRLLLRTLLGACRSSGTTAILGHRVPGGTEADHMGGLLHDVADVSVHFCSGVSEDAPPRLRKNRWGAVGPLPGVLPQFHFARFANVVAVTGRS